MTSTASTEALALDRSRQLELGRPRRRIRSGRAGWRCPRGGCTTSTKAATAQPDDPIVLVHGTPTWSFEYRHLIAGLRPSRRVIALDHLGFGLSERPADASYTPEAHAARFRAFVDGLGLSRFTLVVHDFGGPIALPVALDDPGRVSRLVVLNSWMWSFAGDPRCARWRAARAWCPGGFGRFMYRRLNASLRLVTPSAYGDRRKLTRAIHGQYLAAFPDADSRERVLWTLARALLGSSAYYDGLWRRRDRLAAIPALVVWGMKDSAFRPNQLARWRTALPHATVVAAARRRPLATRGGARPRAVRGAQLHRRLIGQPRQRDVAAVDEPPLDVVVVAQPQRRERRVGQVDAGRVHRLAKRPPPALRRRALAVAPVRVVGVPRADVQHRDHEVPALVADLDIAPQRRAVGQRHEQRPRPDDLAAGHPPADQPLAGRVHALPRPGLARFAHGPHHHHGPATAASAASRSRRNHGALERPRRRSLMPFEYRRARRAVNFPGNFAEARCGRSEPGYAPSPWTDGFDDDRETR